MKDFYKEHSTGSNALLNSHLAAKDSRFSNLYNMLRCTELLSSSDMEEVAEKTGTEFIALEYSAKSGPSVSRKLEKREQELKKISSMPGEKERVFETGHEILRMKDLVRYTQICSRENLIEKAGETCRMLESMGYTEVGYKNYFLKPYAQTGYKGLHINFISPYGQEIELQVHTQESFAAKQKGHELYEIIRSVSADEKEKNKYLQEVLDIHGSVKNPEGYESWPYSFDIGDENRCQMCRDIRSSLDMKYSSFRAERANAECAIFSISKNGKESLYGYEIVFGDGSASRFHWNRKREFAKTEYIARSGREVNISGVQDVKDLDIDINKENVSELALAMKNSHDWWMNMWDMKRIRENEIEHAQ